MKNNQQQNENNNAKHQFSNSQPMTFSQQTEFLKTMSNNKQSSVEYFHDAVNDIIANKRPCNSNEVAKILLEAKAMHKHEIMDARRNGSYKPTEKYGETRTNIQYYNEIFG